MDEQTGTRIVANRFALNLKIAALALGIACLAAVSLTLGFCQRYIEFTVSFPGTSWVHLYPSTGGEAGLLKYKGVRVESAGRPAAVRIPLVPYPMDALLIRIEQPGGVVSVGDIRVVNGLGGLLARIDRNQLENSASSTVSETAGGVALTPTGLSPIIDMRINFATPLDAVPVGAGTFFVKWFVACLLGVLALAEGVRRATRGGTPAGSSRFPLPESGELHPDSPGNRALMTAGVFLVIFGSRLWLVSDFGSELPFWDQWDAEAKHLYLPYLDGTLSPAALFSPHNEHRILLTRLAALALLVLNRTWDPLLQMSLNAALYGGVGAFLFRVLALPAPVLWGGAVALIFSLPFGWQNTLGGFQLQMYLMVGLSLLFLWLTTCCQSDLVRWLGGGSCALLLLFTMASGFLAAAALLILSLLMVATRRGPGRFRSIVPALLISAAALAAGLLFRVAVPLHASLHAGSAGEFAVVCAVNLGWPLSLFPMFGAAYPLSVAGYIAAALLLWSPFMLLVRDFMKERDSSAVVTLLVATGIWAVLQAAAAAFARGSNIFPFSRYQDMFAIGILVNVASLLAVRGSRRDNGKTARFPVVALPWLVGAASGLLFVTGLNFVHDLPEKRSQQQASLEHVQRFLATGDRDALSGKPKFDIPHPEREELALLLENPQIRRILPPSVGGGGDPGRFKPVLGPLLAGGPLMVACGIILFASSVRRRSCTPDLT